MSMNGDMEAVIESLKRLHWAAENRVSEAQALYEQAKAERDHVARMLKVAGVVEEEEKPKPKPKSKKPVTVNEETRAAVLSAIHHWIESGGSALPEAPGSFTAMDLEGLTTLHSSSVRNAITNLREVGIVRAVGLVPGTPRRAPMAYVLGEGNEASE